MAFELLDSNFQELNLYNSSDIHFSAMQSAFTYVRGCPVWLPYSFMLLFCQIAISAPKCGDGLLKTVSFLNVLVGHICAATFNQQLVSSTAFFGGKWACHLTRHHFVHGTCVVKWTIDRG